MNPPAANTDQDGFTGHLRDTDTGLTYMQARYYDPVVGRFLSNDPVGFAEGGVDYFNRYAYTANDPVNNIDPDGKDIEYKGDTKINEKAINYLNNSDTFKGELQTLEESSTTYTIEVDPTATGNSYNPATNTVTYNPAAGLKTSSGDTSSAASSLGHEITHAAEDERQTTGGKTFPKDGVAAEENRATSVQNTINKEINSAVTGASEGIRENYSDGSRFWTKGGVTSNEN